jgi:dihydrofolate reductase
MKPSITLVVAVAENGVIGRDNKMPWHLPADLAHFKLLTWGKPIVMGRKTFESIGKPLPGRTNIVVTRDPAWSSPGVVVAHSIDAAFEAALRAPGAPEVMVIGGAQLYADCLPRAARIEFTQVHGQPEGDTHFAPLDLKRWREVARHEHAADARNAFALTFITYARA